MVKTTGAPMAATVSSPALTSGAISLLQQNLNEQEKQLWMSLGPNWTQPLSVTKLLNSNLNGNNTIRISALSLNPA